MKVPEKYRPICSCGVRMKLVEYGHYYGEARFWDCYNTECKLNNKEEFTYESEPDEIRYEGY